MTVNWSTFFTTNPYVDFDYKNIPLDLQGWGSQHPMFAAVIKAIRPKLICEAGTWKGASAIHMASICRDLNLSTKIICIDTWLGTIESYIWKDHSHLHQDLQFKNGWPQLFYNFIANVMHSGFSESIIPLPQTTLIGARLLKAFNIVVDAVYIDASHDHDDVWADLKNFYELTRDGGIIFGDDFEWSGVAHAVRKFVDEKNIKLVEHANKYAFAKNADITSVLGPI